MDDNLFIRSKLTLKVNLRYELVQINCLQARHVLLLTITHFKFNRQNIKTTLSFHY